jgi:hypothetical protein
MLERSLKRWRRPKTEGQDYPRKTWVDPRDPCKKREEGEL